MLLLADILGMKKKWATWHDKWVSHTCHYLLPLCQWQGSYHVDLLVSLCLYYRLVVVALALAAWASIIGWTRGHVPPTF